jgi:uncharacterized protein (TIRG00374 family)
MSGKIFALLKITVTVLLFYLLFRKVDFHQFWMILRAARLDILLIGFLAIWIGHYMCLFRWRMLMRPLMPILSLSHLFGIYCIGLFFNLTFPTVVGGDVVKVYYAGRPSKRYAQSFAATFLDRDAGMFAMMILACIATIIHPVSLSRIPVALIVWGTTIGFAAVNILLFATSLHQLLTNLLRSLRMSHLAKKIDSISDAFQIMGQHWFLLVNSLIISLINQLLVIMVTWIMAIGLRIDIPVLYFFVFVPVITIISMIPVSLAGMGLRESAFVSLFGLISSAVIILSSLPGGVVYIFFKNHNDVQQMSDLESDFSEAK